MRANVALLSPSEAVKRATDHLSQLGAFLERRRWWIVGLIIVVQWTLVAHEALQRVFHNGWLYENGDDGPWYWTTAWTLGSLHIPWAAVGLGWPYLLSPIAAIFGPNMANGMPAVIALNVLVLAPAAVIGMYLIGERLAGRLFGLWVAFLFAIGPALALSFYTQRTLPTVVRYFLPTGMGLNGLSDFPSMVFAIFGAYLLLRTIDSRSMVDGALCGTLFGFLVVLKPANGPLPLVGVIVLALTLRFRALAAVLVAMLPGVAALTLWKRNGIGVVPILNSGSSGGSSGGATPANTVNGANRYVNVDWHHIGQNLHALGQVFWSVRLLEFLLVAGAIGLTVRARAKGMAIVGWFVTFALIKGGVAFANVYDTSLYRFLLPAWPAWIVIVSGVVFCWPTSPERRSGQHDADRRRAKLLRPSRRAVVVASALVFAVGPLSVASQVSPIYAETAAQIDLLDAPVPIVDFHLRAHRTGTHEVTLDWSRVHTNRAIGWYLVFKGKTNGCYYVWEGDRSDCLFKMLRIGSARTTTFRDTQAVGHTVYRVALVAGQRIDPNTSSFLLLSNPAPTSR